MTVGHDYFMPQIALGRREDTLSISLKMSKIYLGQLAPTHPSQPQHFTTNPKPSLHLVRGYLKYAAAKDVVQGYLKYAAAKDIVRGYLKYAAKDIPQQP